MSSTANARWYLRNDVGRLHVRIARAVKYKTGAIHFRALRVLGATELATSVLATVHRGDHFTPWDSSLGPNDS